MIMLPVMPIPGARCSATTRNFKSLTALGEVFTEFVTRCTGAIKASPKAEVHLFGLAQIESSYVARSASRSFVAC